MTSGAGGLTWGPQPEFGEIQVRDLVGGQGRRLPGQPVEWEGVEWGEVQGRGLEEPVAGHWSLGCSSRVRSRVAVVVVVLLLLVIRVKRS